MANFDFKTATPDTSFPANGFLFGADSQSATDPSIYSHTAYLNYILSLANTWTATQTFNAGATVAGSALTLSGNQSVAAWTTAGVRIKGAAGTLTDTTSSGTVAAAYTNVLGGNTIAASSSTTFTNYYTTFMSEPTAGTNVTFTNKWALGIGGSLHLTNGGAAQIRVTGSSNYAAFDVSASGNTLTLYAQSAAGLTIGSLGSSLPTNSQFFGWGDITLYRDAANTLALRRSTNAQTLRVYFNFGDAANYTRLALKTATGIQTLETESAGTGEANIDLALTPKGTGRVRYGTHSAIAAETVTGYITIKDSGGTERKLAVVS